MKTCTNCGKEIKDQVKFCNFCGKEQVIEKVITNENIRQTDDSINQQQDTQTNQQQQNYQQPNTAPILNQEKVTQLTNRSKNYFSYINKNIKNPIIGKDNKDGYFGLISYALICIFSGLAISHAIGKLMSLTGFSETAFPMFLQITLLLLCSQVVNVLTVYLLSAKIFHTKMSFVDTFETMYAPISLAVYISFLALILSFISTIGIGLLFFICLIITFFFTSISYVANLWSAQNYTQKRNKFYWTIGAIIIGGILQFLVSIILSDILGTSMMDIIQKMIQSSVQSSIPSIFR